MIKKSSLNPNALPFIPTKIEMFNENDTLEGMFDKFEKDRLQRMDSLQQSKKIKLNVPFKRRVKANKDDADYMNVHIPK
jgi:hypothetical protein